jgi:hypothetical protein
VRILLSTKVYGGAGGIERHVASTIRCLGARHEIDVFSIRATDGEYLVRPPQGRVVHPRRWRRRAPRQWAKRVAWRVAEPLLRYRPPPYDVYLHYQYGIVLNDRFPAGVSVVIPCGADVRDVEASFDAVLLEAPDNDVWVDSASKSVVVPPPLNVPAARAEPVDGLPDEYFLTVFNTHSPGKGFALLREVARQSPIPIVWCRSTGWGRPDPAADLPGVVEKVDLSQAQLRHLYEHCRAYVSFDHDPGFGWALADALQYGAPAFARNRGVMTLPDLDTRATFRYDTTDDLLALVHGQGYARVVRELDTLSPARFVERFEALVQSLHASAAPR